MTVDGSSEQSTGALPRLVAGYREFSRMSALPTHSFRVWNALYERLEDDRLAVIADPILLAALAVVGESDPDPEVRLRARGDADPGALHVARLRWCKGIRRIHRGQLDAHRRKDAIRGDDRQVIGARDEASHRTRGRTAEGGQRSPRDGAGSG